MNQRLTFAALRSGTVGWITRDLPRTGRYAGVSFAVTWLVNFAVITTKGGAWGNVVGAASEGTETSGSIYLGLLSLIVTALVVYGIESGWGDLRRSFLALPRAVGRMFRQHGVRMWSIVFWGAAVALLSAGAIKPTVAAVLAIGFLAFAPTALTSLLGNLLTRIWVGLIGFFAPRTRPRVPGLGGQLVAMLGSATGFIVATQGTETAFKLIAAGVLAALSYVVLLNASTRTASAAGFILMGFAFWIAGDAVAQALQGCCGEDHHHPMDPGWKAAGLSTVAGASGAVGGVIGAGVGSVLAQHPQDPSTWDDDDPDGGPRVARDPIPDGPTRTTTITLQGDDARAALDAWRRANAEGGEADIPIPEAEQWDVHVSDGTDTVRQGHAGTRGRVTGIGAVVESDDDIVITVDVTAYTPSASAAPPPHDAGAPADAPNADDEPPPPDTPTDDDGLTPPSAEEAPSEEPATVAPPPAAADDPPPPPPAADDAPPPTADDAPPPTASTSDEPVDEQEGDAEDPGAFAGWAQRTVSGTVPADDAAAIGDLLRGDADEVTLSGDFTGRWAPLLGRTEPRSDGIAVRAPTGDRIVIRVRGGRAEIRHEASLLSVLVDKIADEAKSAGVDIPKVESLVANVKGPLDRLNHSLAATGRELETIVRNDDGSITIVTRPAG